MNCPGNCNIPIEADMSDRSLSSKSILRVAAARCYLGAHPELQGVTGYYFADCKPALPDAHMQNVEMAARLWKVSEDLTEPCRMPDQDTLQRQCTELHSTVASM